LPILIVGLAAVVGATLTWAPTYPCCLPDGECVFTKDWDCNQMGGTLGPVDVPCSEWVCDDEDPIACRVTGGGVDTFGEWDGTFANGKAGPKNNVNRYTFGGQAGAPTAEQPQPYGEWTHHQQRGPDGSFVFHAGTASAPPGTEIDWIGCSDPGWCVQARPAPAKQIDFEGVGTFKNTKHTAPALDDVVPGETMHWFSVHIEDLGEPGKAGKVDPPGDMCPPAGSPGALADCACPDFYHIRIHATEDAGSDVIYEVLGYITGGNLQIHPPVGGSI